MAIYAQIDGQEQALAVVSYSVQESAMPTVPGDTSGGSASFTIVANSDETQPLPDRIMSVEGRRVTLTDNTVIEDTPFKGRGTIAGIISKATRAGTQITLSVDSILNRLNVDRQAAPFFGVIQPDTTTNYIVNEATNPSAEADLTNYSVDPGTGGAATLTRESGTDGEGDYFVRATWTADATTSGGIHYTQDDVTAGTNYTFSAEVRVGLAQSVVLGVQWLDIDSNVIGVDYGEAIGTVQTGEGAYGIDPYGEEPYGGTLSNSHTAVYGAGLYGGTSGGLNSTYGGLSDAADSTTFTTISLVNVVAPVGAITAIVTVTNDDTGDSYSNWTSGSILDVDGLMIVAGSTLYPYADGDSVNGQWTGLPHQSTSQISFEVAQNPGYDATLGNAFRYYLSLVGVPVTSIAVDSSLEDTPVAFRGWNDNVLDMIKSLCTAYNVEVVVVNDIITLQPPHRKWLRVDTSAGISQNVTVQQSSRSVQIYNYNNTWLTDGTAWTADQVYTVEEFNALNFKVTTLHSLVSVNDPVCVSAITPTPYISGTGQYVVTDSNGLIINPDDWAAGGGRLYAQLNPDDPSEIWVQGIAPNFIKGYEGPYRFSSSGADEPAIVITGTGVFTNQETLSLATSVADDQTTQESATPVDNLFIGDELQALNRGLVVADAASGPIVTISGKVPYDPDANGQEFGRINGSRIKVFDGIYRITSNTIDPTGISFDASLDVTFNDIYDLYSLTFAEFDATYAGLTFAEFDALWPSNYTFDDFNTSDMSAPTFDDFDKIYAGATFNDLSVYPYLDKVVTIDAEATV